jgi:ATP-dependent RNA helicase DeaD
VSVVLVPLSRRRKAERMLQEAGVDPKWSGVPQAEDIRRLDQQRMMQDPILTAATSEEDLEMAKLVLASRSPEEIAAALVRIYRSKLPAAEEVFDPGPSSRDYDSPKPSRKFDRDSGPSEYTWFRMDIGRKNNADPEWLLPMICRRGKVTKPDIGSIKITENETRFEISNAAAQRFAQAAKSEDEDDVKIELLSGAGEAPSGGGERERRSFKPRAEGRGEPRGDKPKFEGPRKPRGEPTERKPLAEGERVAYEDRKPFVDPNKPKFDGPRKPRGEGFKPKFAGAGKARAEGDAATFKPKKSAWKKGKK